MFRCDVLTNTTDVYVDACSTRNVKLGMFCSCFFPLQNSKSWTLLSPTVASLFSFL